MSRKFTVVDGTSPPVNLGASESIEALAKECIASDPVSVLLVWEAANYKGQRCVLIRSYPASEAVQRGLMFMADDILFSEE